MLAMADLLHVYSTFAVGGPQIRFAAIANHFGRRWRHAVIAMDGDLACRERLSPGLNVSFPAVDIRKGATLANVRRFRAFLLAMRPRTLVTSNWGSIEWVMASVGTGIRHVHVEDGFGPEERGRQLARRVLTRRVFLRRRTVVVPSRVLERIAVGVWGLDPARVHYVPNGIDLSRFSPRRGVRDGVPVIGTVAALRPEKNLFRLLDAFAEVVRTHPARLVIVGDGPQRGDLEARAAALGIAASVTFAGHQADPSGHYRDFDIFAISSDTEQMPISVLEAMAAGLPVAATDVGDIREMLAEENSPLVGPGLGESLRALLANPALRSTLGSRNRAKAERDYAEGRMFRAYATLWDPSGHDDAGSDIA